MKIGIIDADLIGRKKHRFPNLACMKISNYYKLQENDVNLIVDYDDIELYDKVFISKVFTDTPINENILTKQNVEYGGIGFFYDLAKPLSYEIEHCMPDYNLYTEWIKKCIDNGIKEKEFDYYFNYSLGFTTRGCFRKCEFCVNKNCNSVVKHSELNEFLDKDKPYICLLDDNILGYKNWNLIWSDLTNLNKYFEYKQGMDIRLMTDEKAKIVSKSKYKLDNGFYFAFDNIKDKSIIEEKIKIWKKYCGKQTKFYVLCGFDNNNIYDENFWMNDIKDTFERIRILMTYGCYPYVMRFNKYNDSPYKGMYINIAGWCNQPSMYTKLSFREFCIKVDSNTKTESSCLKYFNKFNNIYSEIIKIYADLKYDDLKKYDYQEMIDYKKWFKNFKEYNNGLEIFDNINNIEIKSIKTMILKFDFFIKNIKFIEQILKNDGTILLANSEINFMENLKNILNKSNLEMKTNIDDVIIIGFKNVDFNKYITYYYPIREWIKSIICKCDYTWKDKEIVELFLKNRDFKSYNNALQYSQIRLNPNYNQFKLMSKEEYDFLMPYFKFDRKWEDLNSEYDELTQTYIRLKKDNKKYNNCILENNIKKWQICIDKNINNFLEIFSNSQEILLTNCDNKDIIETCNEKNIIFLSIKNDE